MTSNCYGVRVRAEEGRREVERGTRRGREEEGRRRRREKERRRGRRRRGRGEVGGRMGRKTDGVGKEGMRRENEDVQGERGRERAIEDKDEGWAIQRKGGK